VNVKPKCIIAEADRFISRLLQRFAEESGLCTTCVQNGPELIEIVQKERPHLLILDVELPGDVRGWQVIRMLRESEENMHLPVIVCSWLQEAQVRSLVGEAAGYLKKPDIHYRDFVHVLESCDLPDFRGHSVI
jgi:two-component system sensor histidine kinase ChiS